MGNAHFFEVAVRPVDTRVYMDTSDPIRSGRTAQSEYKMIIYTPQSEYNPLIGIEFLAEHKSWCSLL